MKSGLVFKIEMIDLETGNQLSDVHAEQMFSPDGFTGEQLKSATQWLKTAANGFYQGLTARVLTGDK